MIENKQTIMELYDYCRNPHNYPLFGFIDVDESVAIRWHFKTIGKMPLGHATTDKGLWYYIVYRGPNRRPTNEERKAKTADTETDEEIAAEVDDFVRRELESDMKIAAQH